MLKAKNCLQIQSRTKYLQQTLVSSEIGHYGGGGGKFRFLFFRRVLLVLKKNSFWEEDWALGYNSMNF